MPTLAMAAAAAAAFNLVCSGTYTTGLLDPSADMGIRGVKMVDRTWIVRVDLDAGRWCLDQCAATEPVARSSETEIVLADDKPTLVPLTRLLRINRESGAFLYLRKVGDFQELAQAVCERATFSGFPSRKF